MGVDVADCDGVPSGSPVSAAASYGEPSRRVAELADLGGELLLGEAGEGRVQRRQEVAVGVAAVLVDALVAGGAGVADVATVSCQMIQSAASTKWSIAGVELGVLLEQLEPLRELPLARDQAAVAADPGLPPRVRELVDAVGLRLGGVVLPELDVGVRPLGVVRAARTAGSRRRAPAAPCRR